MSVIKREYSDGEKVHGDGVILQKYTPNRELIWITVFGNYVWGTWPKGEDPPVVEEAFPEIRSIAFHPGELLTEQPNDPDVFLAFYEPFRCLMLLANDFIQQKLESPVFLEDHELYTAAHDVAVTFGRATRGRSVF
jgi:hypothetical protein